MLQEDIATGVADAVYSQFLEISHQNIHFLEALLCDYFPEILVEVLMMDSQHTAPVCILGNYTKKRREI